MKKIVIFGATGGVGLHATEIAVKKGFQVTVLVRNINKLPENLQISVKVIQGDVLDESAVKKAVAGQDAVVVVLGTGYDLNPTTVLSNGMKNIVSAMKENGIEHVSICLSAFLFSDESKVPERFRDLNADHQRMLDVVKESGLKWVAVLPPHFTDDIGLLEEKDEATRASMRSTKAHCLLQDILCQFVARKKQQRNLTDYSPTRTDELDSRVIPPAIHLQEPMLC